MPHARAGRATAWVRCESDGEDPFSHPACPKPTSWAHRLSATPQARSLAALTPPAALRPVQDAVVKGIEATQKAVATTAAALKKGVAKKGATKAQIQAQVATLQGKLSLLPQQLISAVESVIASPNSTPTP